MGARNECFLILLELLRTTCIIQDLLIMSLTIASEKSSFVRTYILKEDTFNIFYLRYGVFHIDCLLYTYIPLDQFVLSSFHSKGARWFSAILAKE